MNSGDLRTYTVMGFFIFLYSLFCADQAPRFSSSSKDMKIIYSFFCWTLVNTDCSCRQRDRKLQDIQNLFLRRIINFHMKCPLAQW